MIFRHPVYAISDQDKDRILRQQENHCQWCGFSFDQKLDIENACVRLRIVWILDDMGPIACCQFCDEWITGLNFTTIKELRDFVRQKWVLKIGKLRAGIPEKKAKSGPRKLCEACGSDFIPGRPWQKYCSPDCRWKHWDKNHPRTNTTA